MTSNSDNRFQDFFEDEAYITLKNYLYNYLLRKRAVEKAMRNENKDWVLEIGSGISPVLTTWDKMVYSDLSASALEILQRIHGKGRYAVADAEHLPFDDHSFSHVIASEVLEHIENDIKALSEISRVLKPDGVVILTLPHRRFYFAHDDRYVGHYRRYEIADIISLLAQTGFELVGIEKVLGPLEKFTMWGVTKWASFLEKIHYKTRIEAILKYLPTLGVGLFKWCNRFYAGLVWLDASIMPRALSTVLLIKAKKKNPTPCRVS